MEDKYVFISYSSANKAIADATCHILEECGILCWIAPRNIIPGNTWAGNIVQAIRECSLMVMIYSEESNCSSQVANEVDKAFSNGKTIIPFMVDSTPMNDDFDYYLSRKHWLVAYPDYKEMLMPLVEAVATNIGVKIRPPQSTVSVSMTSSSAKDKTSSPDNPRYETAIKAAQKSLLNHELDMAFAELIRPALDDYKNAQFLVRTILTTYARMQKLDPFRFKYIKEQADAGHAFAQYMMSRYHTHIDKNDTETYRYASLCAAQEKSYGFLELALCYEFGTKVERNYDRVHELLDKAVNMDDPLAMLRLAKDSLYGWTRKRNPKRSFTILKRCMDMHVPESFVLMGDMFNEGNSVERDEERALELYRQALAEGYLEAYNSQASYYMVDLVKMQYKDDAEIQKGISLLRKGIECGVVSCLSTLAACYKDGIGVPQKAEQAYRWYKKAAEAGDSFSFYQVGYMHYYGEGCPEDDVEAWKWLSRGSLIPYGACFFQLGVMCQDGHGQEGKTKADCVNYYEESIRMGGAYADEAALRLYDIYRTRSLEPNPLMRDNKDTCRDYDWAPKDNLRALGYLKQLAGMDLGSLTPFKYGAILCTEGHGFTDEFEGIRYLKLAAEKGEPRAAVMLAKIYEKGELVDMDKTQAHSYYQMAADKDCGDGYSGLAKELCAQVIDDVDGLDGSLPDMDEETKKRIIHQAYEYVCKADELGCKVEGPLNDSITAFMIEDDLLSPDECKRLVEMNEKYVHRGDLQNIIDRGVMFHMGRLVQQDLEKAVGYYQLGARLGKECAAKNLGDLYNGEEEGLPVGKQNKPTAAYWYSKDNSDNATEEYDKLLTEGHEIALAFERFFNTEDQTEYAKWVFPYLCDPVFTSDTSKLRIFEWADFGNEPIADEKPQNADADTRYLPKEMNCLYKAYVELSNLLASTYGWSDSLLPPQLTKEDFYPCLSMPHLAELLLLAYRAWNAQVKHGKGDYLQQHQKELEQITLLSSDWTRILDLAEKCTDNDDFQLLANIVDICICLDKLADVYWRLIALNGLVENTDYHLPDNFVKDFADQFFEGTDVLPRSYAIARRLYEQVPYLPEVDDKLKQCGEAMTAEE